MPSSTIYTGTLASFANAASDFSTGVGNWSPGAAGQTTVYRFTYTLQDDNNAQGLNGELGFTWEAQNT